MTDPARQEATQRTSHLLTKAMAENGVTIAELARRLGRASGTDAVHKHISRVLKGATLPRIDTLAEMLRGCGFELTISMRKVQDDDDDNN